MFWRQHYLLNNIFYNGANRHTRSCYLVTASTHTPTDDMNGAMFCISVYDYIFRALQMIAKLVSLFTAIVLCSEFVILLL